jgi:hypothetical protein
LAEPAVRLRNEAVAKAIMALETGENRKGPMSDKSKFIDLIGVHKTSVLQKCASKEVE